jgi:hypothetical protein
VSVGEATGRVKTAEPAKPPRPPVGIASDGEVAWRPPSVSVGEANGRVKTAAPAKPPRPPVGIASDAEGVG